MIIDNNKSQRGMITEVIEVQREILLFCFKDISILYRESIKLKSPSFEEEFIKIKNVTK